MHIFNSKKVTTAVKKTPKNIIFYTHTHTHTHTHTILLLVTYSKDKQTGVITNGKCFEIMVKL